MLVLPCREDANLNNLRSSAYEAIMDLIKYSAKVSSIGMLLGGGETAMKVEGYKCYKAAALISTLYVVSFPIVS